MVSPFRLRGVLLSNRLDFAFDLRVFSHVRLLRLRGEVRVVAQLADSKEVGDGDEFPKR